MSEVLGGKLNMQFFHIIDIFLDWKRKILYILDSKISLFNTLNQQPRK